MEIFLSFNAKFKANNKYKFNARAKNFQICMDF